MKVIAGPLKGHTVKMHQFANDWITADVVHCPFDNDGDGNCRRCARPIVLSPLHVELENAEEAQEFKVKQQAGFFWTAYELGEDRHFHPKARYDAKEHHRGTG